MPNVGRFPDLGPHQEQVFGIDFGQFLQSGVTLSGVPTLSLTVLQGRDPTPRARVLVAPQVSTAPIAMGGTGVTNAAILFKLGDCLSNTVYSIDVYCDTTSDEVVEAWGNFRCVDPRT